MKAHIIFTLTISLALSCPFADMLGGLAGSNPHAEANEDRPAVDKKEEIMKQVRSDDSIQDWLAAYRYAELFVESMQPTFDTFSDYMPNQYFGTELRPKIIHTIGAVASAKWVPIPGHNFTGIYSGSDNVVIRFSLAKKPELDPPVVRPSFGVKILRDNTPSCNIVAMYSLAGQPTYNIFGHDLTNHVPYYGKPDTAQKLVLQKFLTATAYPTLAAISHCASHDSQGMKSSKAVSPYRLVLHPSIEAHTAFTDSPHGDDKFHLTDLDNFKVDILYHVYAQAEPTNQKLQHIADIKMTEPFRPSGWADQHLFFRHQRMEQDFEARPDWEEPAKKILEYQKTFDNWCFPDLPWN